MGTIFIFSIPSKIKSSYGLFADTQDGEKIAFNIFEPAELPNDPKAILLGHGFMVNKEFLKGYAIELASAGFIAVPFDFRGHGQSSGELNRGNLIDDVKAVKKYIIDKYAGITEFGYLGYSMGGGPGSEIVKEDTSFKCLIGIGTGLPSEENQTVKVNSGQFLNILMILAKYDEAFDLKTLKEQMGLRLGIQGEDVEVNQLYGDFNDGSASMIYLDDNSDHLTTAWDQDFIREARNWVKNTFPEIDAVDENFYVNIRAGILIIQLIGGIGFFFLIIEPISSALLKEQERAREETEISDDSVARLSLKGMGFSILLGIPGMIISLPIVLLLPLPIASGLLTVLFGAAFSLLMVLWRTGKKKQISLKELFVRPFRLSRPILLKQMGLGIMFAFILYLILYTSIGLNYMAMAASIYRAVWIPFYLIQAFIMFYIFSLFFQGMLQSKMEKGLKGILKASGLNWIIVSFYMCFFILGVSLLQGSFFFAIALILAVPMILLCSFVSSVIYAKTGSIIAGSMTNCVFIVFIVATTSPFMSLLTMVAWFF